MKRTYLYLSVLLLCPWLTVSAYGQNEVLSFFEDSGDAIKITSLESNTRRVPDGYETVFDGTVRASQGSLTLTCERLALAFKKESSGERPANPNKKSAMTSFDIGDLRSATASGNVKIVYKETMATSGKLLYDAMKRTVTLLDGRPRLWRGADVVVADTIVIYIDENRTEFKGGKDKDNKQIEFRISPSKNTKEKK